MSGAVAELSRRVHLSPDGYRRSLGVPAPSASAAPSATVTIQTVTPPAVSVDQGGTVTFVNGIVDYVPPAAKHLPHVLQTIARATASRTSASWPASRSTWR